MPTYFVDSSARIDGAIRSAGQGDSIDLDVSRFANFRIVPFADGWGLTDDREVHRFRREASALSRILHKGITHLLVGDGGYSDIQSAIYAASGGETILIAPGTYAEGRSFTKQDLACPGLTGDGCGLLVDKSLVLQGVAEDGSYIVDCDDVVASVVALWQSGTGESFIVTAPNCHIHGLSFVPAGLHRGRPASGRVFGIYAERFSLRASVIERGSLRRLASAIHLRRSWECDPARGLSISGNLIQGSITLDGTATLAPMSATIVDNDIVADLLPPVWVACDTWILASDALEALPLLRDNTLHAPEDPGLSYLIQFTEGLEVAPGRGCAMDAYVAQLLKAHDGIGAVIFDETGHVRTTMMPDPVTGQLRGCCIGIYSSIQAAINQAQHGDTLYIGAGAYQERLSIDGKRLVLVGATDSNGNPLVKISPPQRDSEVGNHRGFKGYAVIEVSGATQVRRTPAQIKEEQTRASPTLPNRVLEEASVLDLLASADIQPVHLRGSDGKRKGGFGDIQAALDAADQGDRIDVAAGTYEGDLWITRAVTLCGANAGLPGYSAKRGLESHISGRVRVSREAAGAVIDGVSIRGELTLELTTGLSLHLSVRSCIIDGRGGSSAVCMLTGSPATIAGNLLVSGSEEAIYVPHGFENLVISGNRLQLIDGASGIVLRGGAGRDCAHIIGNTLVGGDYGILVEVDAGLQQPGDAITITGNCFGESRDDGYDAGPAVAAISADGPVPRGLMHTLGSSLGSNLYNIRGPALQVDLEFDSRGMMDTEGARASTASVNLR